MSESLHNQKQGVYLPKTFAERGLVIGYTTPILQFARLRRSSSSMVDVLIPSLSGGVGTFVVPYRSLPEVLSLTVFDRALHEKLTSLLRPTPMGLRKIKLEVGTTGLGGPLIQQWALSQMEADKSRPDMILLYMIEIAVRQLGSSAEAKGLDLKALATTEGQAQARRALQGFAESARTTPRDLINLMERWAKSLTPLGLPDGRVSGPYLDIVVGLEAMAKDLRGWMLNEPPETAEMAERTASAALDAAARARKVIAGIGESLDMMRGPLSDPAEVESLFSKTVDIVTHLLDGWLRILDNWNAVLKSERWEQRQVLEAFIQFLPVLPSEALGQDIAVWVSLRTAQQRWRNSGLFGNGDEVDPKTQDALSRFKKEPI